MNRYGFLLALALTLFCVNVSLAQDALPQPPQHVSHVLVITLDGARPDALQSAADGNLMTLAAGGAADWAAHTVSPSTTLPAHTSILTGVEVDVHGVTHDDLIEPCLPVTAPTFLTLAAEAGYSTAIVTGKDKFCLYDQSDATSFYLTRASNQAVFTQTDALLRQGVQVIFAHFPSTDFAGHMTGFMSGPYRAAVDNADRFVGRLLNTLDELGLTDETLVIVTADHGGHGFFHHVGTGEDSTVPWVVSGPGVVPGTMLQDVSVVRTAPTVLWALGLPLPASAQPPALEAFGLVSSVGAE
jgi:predicted AlkP superfamily pyrophosphatase or phosphodiesterase